MTHLNNHVSLPATPTIATSLQWAMQQLAALPDSRRDSELLLMYTLAKPHSYLVAWPEHILPTDSAVEFARLIQARQQGVPTAYLLGEWAAYQLTLTVTPDTLIPRPETDTLIAACLQQLPNQPLCIADLGTGCGTVALNVAQARSQWHVIATDISIAALRIARHNAKRHHITNVDFVAGDWYVPLAGQSFAAIVSNPPYIDAADPHLTALQHEPSTALVAAENGLAVIAHLIADAPMYLQTHGWLLLEHGYTQGPTVRAWLTERGFKLVSTLADLNQCDRVTIGMWPGKIH